MKKLLVASAAALAVIAVAFGGLAPAASAGQESRVRVIHASPDAPNVDVYADGSLVLSDVPFKAASDYLTVPAGPHNFQVFAAGADPASDSPVIDADATLDPSTDYTIVALGRVAEIQAGVFVDNNAAPADGQAHVRVIHASPDAPAVDVALAGGPVVFANLAFGESAGPEPVDAGTYDFEVRPAGTTDVALPINDAALEAGQIYTVLAVGLLEGEPALEAVVVANDPAPAAAAPAPSQPPATTAPSTGTGDALGGSTFTWLAVAAALVLASGAIATGAGLAVRRTR